MAQTPGQGTSSFKLHLLLAYAGWLHRRDLAMMFRDQTANLSSLRGHLVYFKDTMVDYLPEDCVGFENTK